MLKTRFLLLTLSLFYDVAFVDRVWTEPDLFRASVGVIGTFMTASVGLVYAVLLIANVSASYDVAAALIVVGLSLFIAGSLRGRLNIGFNISSSTETLRSRGTVLCLLTDAKQSSSFIEVIVNEASFAGDENSLKAEECYLVFATEIWRESLTKKGLNILGEVFSKRKEGNIENYDNNNR